MDSIKSSIILEYSKVLTYFIEKMKDYQVKQMRAAIEEEDRHFCRGMVCSLSDVSLILANVIEAEEKKQKEDLNNLLLQIRDEVQYFHKSPYNELDIPVNLDPLRYANEYEYFRNHFNLFSETTLERRFRLERESANLHEGVEEAEDMESFEPEEAEEAEEEE